MDVERADGHVVTSEAREDGHNSRAVASNGSATAPLEKVLAMSQGDGEESSYSKNSTQQAFANKMALLELNDGLERVSLPSEGRGPVVVADLGSSSGPNAIGNVALVVDKLRPRLPKDAEFQAYFNDLPSNDFNNLFQLLTQDNKAKNFYAAGVPGSYFNRLFAQSSVHVFYSFNCLHWLSELPEAVIDKSSPAFNKGSIWIMHSRSTVAASYKNQAALDLRRFLLARAAELVSGGLLFFHCGGRLTSEPNEPTNDGNYEFQQDLDGIWSDLVAEGLLIEQQRDTFNIGYYLRSIEDVREVLASCGSLFDVLTAKMQMIEYSPMEVFETPASEPAALARKMVARQKAWLNNLLERHVGKKVVEVIWQRYEQLFEKRIRTTSPEDLKVTYPICVVSLIRK